jgi:hypothetical protein
MKRTGSKVVGVSVAGLLFATPSALATEEARKGSTASDQSSGSASSGGSEARGSGQAGESTGARPGEVTGSAETSGGTSAKERRAAAAAENEISGTVESYDREKRTLSLSSSEKKLKLTDDTQVLKDGARVPVGQLMEGDEVRASFSGSGDEVEVAVIEITPGSAPAGAAATPGSKGPSSGSATKGGSPKGTAAGTSSETGSGSSGTK